MIGILGAHGHSLDILETHSWAQVSLLAECILQNEISKMDMLIAPIAAALGVEYKPGSISGKNEAPKRMTKEEKAQQESSLLFFAKMNGLYEQEIPK